MTKLSTLTASTALSRTVPASLAGGATLPVTARKILAVNEQIAGSTFNIPYTAEGDYVQENAATGTDAAGGAFTLANSAGAAIDANTRLLIHADGANGSTEIVDERGITLFGNSCAYFDGASYWRIPASYKTAFGTTQDFTYELWMHPTGIGGIFLDWRGGTAAGIYLDTSASGLRVIAGSSDNTYAGVCLPNTGWHHVSLTRYGGTMYIRVDGTNVASFANAYNYTGLYCDIGRRADGGITPYFTGWIDQIRVSKVARYTGAFTPPTSTFTTDADTVYLFQFDDGHGSQFIRDASKSGHEVSCVNNDAALASARAKFGSTSLGLPGTNNARVFVAQNKLHSDFTVGSDAFTIDGQFYLTNASATRTLFLTGQEPEKGLRLEVHSDGRLYLYAASSNSAYDLANGTDCGAFLLNQWNHVAVTRSGTSLYVFLNGVVAATISVSTSSVYTGTINAFVLGGLPSSGTNLWVGHVDEFRFKRGQASWTSNFTPPTSPYTSDDYTVLLLHFEGANGDKVTLDSSESSYGNNGFGDTTTPALTFVNSAALSTAQTRGGNSTSLALNGSSQYASIQFATPSAGHPLYFAAWEQLCIEGWFYQSNFTGTQRCWSLSNASLTAANQLNTYVTTGGVPTFGTGAADIATGPTLSAGWNHVAVVRDGRGWTVYSNGVAGTTVQPQTNPAYASEAYTLYLGSWMGSGNYLNGAIDSFRITHGKPRYTANFTPGNLTQDADTALLWVFSGASGQKWVKELSKNTALIPATGARTVRDGLWIAPPGNVPVISTAQAMFGSASLYNSGIYTGSGVTLAATASNILNVGSNFTAEARIYVTGLDGGIPGRIFSSCSEASATAADSWELTINPSRTISFYYVNGTAGSTITTSFALNLNTWYHVAVVRNGTGLNIYINGVSYASGTVSGINAGTRPLILGNCVSPNTASYVLRGYIDEIRLSNTARWTANFTPPTLPYGQQYATGPFWVATKPGASSLDLSAFSSIDNAAFTGAEPATTTLRFLISTDAYATALKVWNGSAWVSSGYAMSWIAGAGTLTTAATAAQLSAAGNSWTQLAAGLVALDVSDIASLNIVAVLTTANQAYTPVLDAITLTMDEYVEMTPGSDYTVRFKDAAPVAQPMTVTRTKPGTGNVSVTYLP